MTQTLSRAKALAALFLAAALVLAAVVFTAPSAAAADKPEGKPADKDLTVMSFNLWYGTQVGPSLQYQAVADTIREVNADVVFFQETVTYQGEPKGAAKPIADILGWHAFSPRDTEFYPGSASLISKYPIIKSELLLDDKEHNRWAKAQLQVGDDIVTAYSAHLEYEDYAVYFPRGFAGHANGPDWPEEYKDWKKLPNGPVTDNKVLSKINEESGRPASAKRIVEDAKAEAAKGHFVVFGGDFNEASALDWTEETKDMFARNGVAHKWETTQTILDAGFKDTYREIHPDPKKAPGTTWPVKNWIAPAEKSAWMTETDERDRIDFIFYQPNDRISLKSAQLVGPQKTVKKGEVVSEKTEDTVFTPKANWVSDHRATMATFTIKAPAAPAPEKPGSTAGSAKQDSKTDGSAKAGDKDGEQNTAGIAIGVTVAVLAILAAAGFALQNFAPGLLPALPALPAFPALPF